MAIAFDTSANGGFANASTLTWSHTCTGSNLVLFVHVCGDTVGTDPTGVNVTGVTYNTVAMALIAKVVATGDRWIYLFALIAPATGAHNIVTSGSSAFTAGLSASYTGVSQSGLPDAFATNTATGVGSGVAFTCTVTTIADNCWTVLATKNGVSTSTAGTGTTIRWDGGPATACAISDSNGAVTPPGAQSMSISTSGSGNWAGIIASFAPVTTARRLGLLGVG